MKRTFKLTHEKIKSPRLVESAKYEVRKYIKRKRKKELPKGVDFWDFDCKFGTTAETAKKVHMAELTNYINDAEQKNLDSFYIEIEPTHGKRTKKPKEPTQDD